eukprot:GHVL01020199.1.p1 GENE.GHVL01020199.1~~GHVL01020199.1.p1  ORF type:complete len:535 (-),score=88.32 GHVL01020199.1:65-1669(-)
MNADLRTATDLGVVALQCRASQQTLFKPQPLGIRKVLAEMCLIAKSEGKDSQSKKRDRIKALLTAAQGTEAKFIVRFLQKKLRIGVSDASVLTALACAFVLTRPAYGGNSPIGDVRRSPLKMSSHEVDKRLIDLEAALRVAHAECPLYDKLILHLLEGRDETNLHEVCNLTPGVPVKPMLAKPTKGIDEILARFSSGGFTCEFKYDGERAQIHLVNKDKICVYSRNSEDMTGKYPDVAEIVKEALADDVTSIVLDSEVVAWDFENSKILPFQTLTTRKRKDVSVENVTVPICLFPFDCIYYNDRSLAKLSFRERREYLHKAVKTIPGRLQFARFMNLEDPDDIQAFLGESVDDECEGLIIKTLDQEATYEPSKRSTSWLKLKKDYIDGLTDSVDLVPMGGWYGKGKRTGWFGNFILGIYDPDREEYQSICKAGTGFSDAALEEHKTFFGNEQNQLKTKPNYYNINEKLTPDVWFVPCQVSIIYIFHLLRYMFIYIISIYKFIYIIYSCIYIISRSGSAKQQICPFPLFTQPPMA